MQRQGLQMHKLEETDVENAEHDILEEEGDTVG